MAEWAHKIPIFWAISRPGQASVADDTGTV